MTPSNASSRLSEVDIIESVSTVWVQICDAHFRQIRYTDVTGDRT